MGRHLTRWLIPLPAIVLSFWPTVVRADAQPGLNAVGYTIINQLPTKSDDLYPTCGNEIENNINRNFDYELFQQCGGDLFMLHYTGFITIPANNTIKFMVAADDGGTVKIGTTEFGTWNYKGCSWSTSTSASFSAGSYSLDAWYFEGGGNGCWMLAWDINNEGWEMVPDSAFTQQAVATTTTTSSTTSTTTTTSSTTSTSTTTTTTTLPLTTTTSSTTTLPQETTTTTEPVQSSTTTSTTSTTTTTTTTEPPAPTTTQAPYTPPQTTTTSEPVVTTTSSTTTTTSLPEPSTTVEETTSTTVPVEPDPTVPESLPVQSSVPPTLPDETTPPTSQPSPETSIQETSSTTESSSSTTTIPEPGEPISDTKVAEILTELKTAAPAQIVAAIEQVLASNITSDQAVSIASSPEVLAAVTEEQAEAIFEEIVVEELTAEVAEELVAVLNEAPTKVKKAFQETINVFAGVFDSFQMVGQTIPVGERRTLVAVSNTLVAVGASLRRRNT